MIWLLLAIQIFLCIAQPQPPGGFFGYYTDGPVKEKENEWIQSMCGQKFPKPSSKSMNSDKAAITDAPYAVSLIIDGYDQEYGLCSGVLISPRHVLTAAHCVTTSLLSGGRKQRNSPRKLMVGPINPQDITVILGDSCAKESYPCWENLTTTRIEMNARRIYVPDKYIGKKYSDIAIVELERNVKLNKNIFPICLTSDVVRRRQIMHIFSYGTESPLPVDNKRYSLQMIKTKIINCLDETYRGVQDADKRVDDFCTRTGVRDRPQQPCKGDSGGGVVSRLYNDGRDRLVGLVNSGVPCVNQNGYPKGYVTVDRHVKINSFINWICQKTGVCADEQKQDYLSWQQWKEDKEMYEDKVLHILQCPDYDWTFSLQGSEGLCMKVIPESATLEQAKYNCENIGAVLAPVRSEAEQEAIAVHYLEVNPNAYEQSLTVRVGAVWHPEITEYKWFWDGSVVSGNARSWIPENPRSRGSDGTKEQCLSLVWVDKKSMRVSDFPCTVPSTGFACAKQPAITISGSPRRS